MAAVTAAAFAVQAMMTERIAAAAGCGPKLLLPPPAPPTLDPECNRQRGIPFI